MANKEQQEKVAEELNLKETDSAEENSRSQEDSFSPQIEVPEVFPDISPDYKVIKQIGKGGMGRVYEVKDLKHDRVVAIKVLNASLANDKAALKRFEQEAEAAINLNHTNLGVTYGHGTTISGEPYIVLDYYEGQSLADIIEKEGVLEPKRALALLEQICDGLKHAHLQGVVHRDLKPTNIIVSPTEEGGEIARIVDFGIAKVMPKENRETHNLTETGEVFGSPNYMSPEQCLGFMLDNRSDIYSLGCLIYEMLTGDPPFGGTNPIQVVVKHINEEIKPFPDSRGFDKTYKKLEGVALKCLEKDQANRYQSMQDLLKDLNLIAAGKQPSKFKRKVKQKREFTKRQLIGTIVGIVALVFYGGVSAVFFDQTYLISAILFGILNFLVLGGIYVGFGSFFDQIQKIEKLKNSATGWWLTTLSISFGTICLTVAPYSIIGCFLYYFHKQLSLHMVLFPSWVVPVAFYDLFIHTIALFFALVSAIGILFFRGKKLRRLSTFAVQFVAISTAIIMSFSYLYSDRISTACAYIAGISNSSAPEVSRVLANVAYELKKSDTNILYLMAESEIENGNYARAINALDNNKAISKAALKPVALKVLAYRKQGKFSEALRAVSIAYSQYGHTSSRRAQLENMKGEIYEDMKKFDMALKSYDKALTLSNRQVVYKLNKARMLLALKRPLEARSYIEKINLNKPDNRLEFLLAMIKEQSGDISGARKSFSRCAGAIGAWFHPSFQNQFNIKSHNTSSLANIMSAYAYKKYGDEAMEIQKLNSAKPLTRDDLASSDLLKNTGLNPSWTEL